jgi:glycolate oxidase FAD binding subunit
MLAEVPGERLDNELVAPDWDMCRDQQLPFFAARPAADALLWRISVPQTAAVLDSPNPTLVEWHGALRWLWAPASESARIQRVAQTAGGSAEVYVDLDAAHQVLTTARPLKAPGPALQAISQRLKASFDPQGIFNPGLSSHANQARA